MKPIIRTGWLTAGLAVVTAAVLLATQIPAEEQPVAAKLLKPHEASLTAGSQLHAGSTARLGVQVYGVRSLTETVPIAGADVQVELRGPDGLSLLRVGAKTDAQGRAEPKLSLPPDAEAGNYTLVVATKSAAGKETIERPVQLRADPKVMLTTDKPIYQPGQMIHVRALALYAFDMRPLAEKAVTFEIEDPRGNKVFKKTATTTAHGVSHIDFQLADEVNMGDYRIRAIVGDYQADKTVTVKRYVLPKFKGEVTADKAFYQPKETLKAKLQSDYFFGKPVAGGKVAVTASTFDVQFTPFFKWEGTTDAQGHAEFEVALPATFVGQAMQKGDAVVQLEVKVTDTADHTETFTKSWPVSDRPIRVSLIPESGRVLPGLTNRIFAVALYPDNSPAADTQVRLWAGKDAQGAALATARTDEAGLAILEVKPDAKQFRQMGGEPQTIEMIGGGVQQVWLPKSVWDVTAQATDTRGQTARASSELTAEGFGENVLLRPDRAVYRAGDTMRLEIISSAGLPTVYVDIVRGGQVLLTDWLDLKDGKASKAIDLPSELAGTLEVHAWQALTSGEVVRDSRVIVVQSRDDLNVKVEADQTTYRPGETGQIRFEVTDAAGKPVSAALGVVIVDESVYALSEIRPGLEKVYFALQQELIKPSAQILGGPEAVGGLLIQPKILPAQQRAAEALLTAVRPKLPGRVVVEPMAERKQQAGQMVMQIGSQLFQYAAYPGPDRQPPTVLVRDGKTWSIAPNVIEAMVKAQYLAANQLKDPFGKPLTLATLQSLEPNFTPERLGEGVTRQRMAQLANSITALTTQPANQGWKQNGRWNLPARVLIDAVTRTQSAWAQRDAWNTPLRLVSRTSKKEKFVGPEWLAWYDLVSAGPDQVFDSGDDITFAGQDDWLAGQFWWTNERARQELAGQMGGARFGRNRMMMMQRGMILDDAALPMAAAAPGAAPPQAAREFLRKGGVLAETKPSAGEGGGDGGSAIRVREYFPETMLWEPALITDDAGQANLVVPFADSITSWRLTASASSKAGQLGGVAAPLRVFQDFFVDLDLPVSLTQNDEIAFPVAVYNYLPEPQTVKLELARDEWFTLLDKDGPTRTLDLKPGEVTSVKFRIRARRPGQFPLTVTARGSKLNDAIKRSIEVLPDGEKHESIFTDRLTQSLTQRLTLPEEALPETEKLFVRIYPGVFSQVIEGLDGMLRMPTGCFEQTSSSAYPNILVVDYIKKHRLATPELLAKSESYLNAGYQRLLTFERPGGGFDWWGSGEPLVWLSAYGLQEFSDMSRVWPIDRGIITRTQTWLMKQRDKDGTWSKIGATHGETIERMGDPKLLLTSYVTWSLLESGLKDSALKVSVDYIAQNWRQAGDNPYVLALAANALASWDAKHPEAVAAVAKLATLEQPLPEMRAICFPCEGKVSLTYARGNGVTIEATALTVLAMVKTGAAAPTINKALTYLLKQKEASGTWGSTQATILALKALIAGAGGTPQQGESAFRILVNDVEAARGSVTPENAELMQAFELKGLKPGLNDIDVKVDGETNLMCSIISRHYAPRQPKPLQPKQPSLTVDVSYDRKELTTKDVLTATAKLTYAGPVPTYMVMLDLGVPPGFSIDTAEFAAMVTEKKIEKFSVTARQVILYLGDVKPGDVKTFTYSLRPKYPVKAQTPASVAYEYNTPKERATAAPVLLTVAEAK